MKLFRKIAAVASAAALAVLATASMMVSAGADSIYDTAKAISSGNQVSTTLYSDGDHAEYKVNVSKDGLLTLTLTAKMSFLFISVFDSDGNELDIAENNLSSGEYVSMNDWYYWNWVVEQIKGTVSYQVSKGDYYIRFSRYKSDGNGKLTFTATFPTNTSTAKINYITINLEQGDTLSLGASITGNGTVTWKSSNTYSVTVTQSGKITAKNPGSSIITAKCGKTNKKVKINVS